jgi:hypothetical protein
VIEKYGLSSPQENAMLIRPVSSPRLQNTLCRILSTFALTVFLGAALNTQTNKQALNQARPAPDYGALPLSFEANQGQADPSVKFLSHGSGYSLFLTDRDAVLELAQPVNCRAASHPPVNPEGSCQAMQDVIQMKLSSQRLSVSDPHPTSPVATGEAELPGKVNYFIGNDPARWQTDLPTFARVRYKQVYPGIDLVYYGTQSSANQGTGNPRQLEYDFIVAPGASASAIRLAFTGEKNLRISSNGDLVLKASQGSATFRKPVIYQEKDGRRELVEGSFRWIARNAVGFYVANYDRARPLVIDPVLVYSTYLGGSGESYNPDYLNYSDQGNGIAVDADGSAYVIGSAGSTDFPMTSGAYQSQNKAAMAASGHGSTVFVSKFNAAGTALLYSTYLGGSGSYYGGDYGYAIALDSQKNAYLTGTTSSGDFPTTKAGFLTTYQPNYNNTNTGFVAELNAAGSALVYSTYIGGATYATAGNGIAVDSTGNAYVTGYTYASDFPVTSGAFQKKLHATTYGISNAFVTKVNSGGTSLLYSTYLGGSGSLNYSSAPIGGDQGNAIVIDASGNAYVTGHTFSPDFPVTAGVVQPTYAGTASALDYVNTPNAFVTKLNPEGSKLVYSTFLGGSGVQIYQGGISFTGQGDEAHSIAIDTNGNAYVGGSTHSLNFPLTTGALNGTGDNNGAGFVSKLNATATALDYSTFLGVGGASIAGLAIDSDGKAYLTGAAGSGFPETSDAIPSQTCCAFIAKLNSIGSAIEYGTLLGGSGSDAAAAIALDSAGNAYVTGNTGGTSFPTTTGAFQTQNKATANNSTNAFVSKLALSGETADIFGTATAFNASAALPKQGQSLTLTIQVTGASGSATPTGEVTLTAASGSNAFPTTSLKLNSSGSAKWTSSTLAPGAYTLNASYEGDSTHLISANSVQFRVVGPPAIFFFSPDNPVVGNYGGYYSPVYVWVQDSTNFGLQGLTVTFGGAPFSFAPASAVTGSDGVATTHFTSTMAGTFTMTASTNGLTAITLPVTVYPAQLTDTVHPNGRSYGEANPTFTNTFSGLIGTNKVTATDTSTATPTSPVGNYPITVTLDGPAVANYALTVIGNTLKVVPAPLTVTPKTVTLLYGQSPPATLPYTITGFVNGQTVSLVSGAPILSTTATATSPAGTYPITITSIGTLSAPNYTFFRSSGQVVVHPANLTLAATSYKSTYGQTPPQPAAYTLTGFVNGDTSSVVSGAPVLSTTATSSSPVGNYPIQIGLGTLSAQNYRFERNGPTGYVEVEKAPLTATATSLSMTQGDAVPALTYFLSGFVNGDAAATAVTGTPHLTTTATSSSKPGNYPITITLGTLASKNYAILKVNGVLTVLP